MAKKIIYSTQTTDFEPGGSYRNPQFWAGETEKCDSVEILGDYPKIAEAYKKVDVEVSMKKGTKAKEPVKKEGNE